MGSNENASGPSEITGFVEKAKSEQNDQAWRSTHSAEVSAVSALDDSGSDTESATASRAGADDGLGLGGGNGLARSLGLAGGDGDAGGSLRDVDGLFISP